MCKACEGARGGDEASTIIALYTNCPLHARWLHTLVRHAVAQSALRYSHFHPVVQCAVLVLLRPLDAMRRYSVFYILGSALARLCFLWLVKQLQHCPVALERTTKHIGSVKLL